MTFRTHPTHTTRAIVSAIAILLAAPVAALAADPVTTAGPATAPAQVAPTPGPAPSVAERKAAAAAASDQPADKSTVKPTDTSAEKAANKPDVTAPAVSDQKSMPQAQGIAADRIMRASKLIGKNVHGTNDKKVGEIKDLIVDLSTGNVRYAVLAFDPGMFKSDKLFSVPLNQLAPVVDKDYLSYKTMSKEQLKTAAMDKTDWKQALTNRQYLEGVDKTYGLAAPPAAARAVAASDLIGTKVKSRAGKSIGEIQEVVVDMTSGKVPYAVLAFDPGIFSGEKLFAFSLASFVLGQDKDKDKDKDDLILNVDQAKIAEMKNFGKDDWAKLTTPEGNGYVNSVSK